ncbi:MAG: hypothetical protein P4L26_15950, partial [Terracidiphilus sp.]|nr:hypothetical protein [Terracidiphilus sp.]
MLELFPRPSSLHKRFLVAVVTILAVVLFCSCFLPLPMRVLGSSQASSSADSKALLWLISIDYPLDGSIFPPGITPPTFLWRDAAADSWQIDIAFADNSSPIHFEAEAQRMRIGPIDKECISNTNELPQLTPQQAASWTWTPDAATWQAIQAHTSDSSATVTITGYARARGVSSQAHISLTTSSDPVGAPIFYRDVPLMPSAGANGTVQPLSPAAIHLIKWRLRDIRQPQSRTVLTNMPTCANCHSFSRDGKTMGIDV